MKLRTRIILGILTAALVPLLVTLWIVGSASTDELNQQSVLRLTQAADYVEQVIESERVEALQYLTLLGENPLLDSINGFNALQNIHGTFYIYGNDKLKSIQ